MRKLFCFVSALLLISIAGCGGGGGDDSGPVASTETFQTRVAFNSSISSSRSNSFTLSGTSSWISISGSGTSIQSSLSTATFEGMSCNNQVTTSTGTIIGNNQSFPYGDTYTEYYTFDNNYIGSSGFEYTVVNGSMVLPLTAKVNDTGILFTENRYSSSNKLNLNGTNTVSFSLEPDTANTALLKFILVEKDIYNSIISTSITVLRLTPSGSFTMLYETYVGDGDNMMITY